MGPPPRPPIICYDLQPSSNSRRMSHVRSYGPSTGITKTPKVTLIPKTCNSFVADTTCWGSQALSPSESDGETPVKQPSPNPPKRTHMPTRASTILNERLQNKQYPDPAYNGYNTRLSQTSNMVSKTHSYRSADSPFAEVSKLNQPSSIKARHAYGQKLRLEAEERERRIENKKAQLAMQARLEEISAQLESAKRVHDNLLKTFGMSHNAAKYIQKQDQDYAKLRRKVDEFAETRAKELGRRVQQMKQFHQMQRVADEKAETRRKRDVSKLIHFRQGLSSTLNSESSTSQSTPTISPESSSSHMSSIFSPVNRNDTKSQTTIKSSPKKPSPAKFICLSRPKAPTTPEHLPETRPACNREPIDFSFYKPNPLEQQTLEITDMEFFNRVEDKTMLEVNELLYKMQSELKDLSDIR